MKFYPVAGRLIRHPLTMQPLDADGIELEPGNDHYVWFHKLLADGDVADQPPAPLKSDTPAVPGTDPKTGIYTSDATKPPSAGGPIRERVS